MKKTGSILEFKSERAIEIMKAYRHAANKAAEVRLDDIITEIVKQPASRFWVSEERACCVISSMIRGEDVLQSMRGPKRRMYQELHKRVAIERQLNPRRPLNDIVAEVIHEPAPEFYMKPLTARDIIYKYKNM